MVLTTFNPRLSFNGEQIWGNEMLLQAMQQTELPGCCGCLVALLAFCKMQIRPHKWAVRSRISHSQNGLQLHQQITVIIVLYLFYLLSCFCLAISTAVHPYLSSFYLYSIPTEFSLEVPNTGFVLCDEHKKLFPLVSEQIVIAVFQLL